MGETLDTPIERQNTTVQRHAQLNKELFGENVTVIDATGAMPVKINPVIEPEKD